MGPANAPWPRLADEIAVFRAYRNRSHHDPLSRLVAPSVFLRREAEAGLSVGLTKEAALRHLHAFGVCRLHVGEVRQAPDSLDVIQDAETHAEIRGVPTRQEDEARALRIARYLARVAVDVS